MMKANIFPRIKMTNILGQFCGDRRDLGLHSDEIELLNEAGPVNSDSAAVLIGGSMSMMTQWMDSVSLILMAYYAGQEGGKVLAEILFGDVNPSGKLPYVVPYLKVICH